jgi:hypothetical protein
MKRLALAIAALGFVTFVGIQTVHVHSDGAHDDCQICVLGAQASRHVSVVVTAPVPVQWSVPLAEKSCAKPLSAHRLEASARGPPLA